MEMMPELLKTRKARNRGTTEEIFRYGNRSITEISSLALQKVKFAKLVHLWDWFKIFENERITWPVRTPMGRQSIRLSVEWK